MKINSRLIILALCFLFNQSKAQNYFNKRIDLFGKADLTANIFIDNNQYYVTGGGFNAAQTDISLSVLKFDNNCNQIKETHNFQNNAWFYGGTTHGITKINDSVLCTIGFRSGPTSMKGYLYWYKTNLDSIRYKEYGFINNDNAIYTQILYANKYHYLIGYTDSANTNQNVLLIKTDTAGNEIWKKKIGITGMDETGYCIKQSQDGNLIICGNKNPTNDYTNAGAYILKADTSGTILWQQWFPTNYGTPANSLEELPNGDILVVSGKGYGFNSTTSQPYSRFQVIKLTATGSLLFNKSYGNTEIATTFYSSIINKKNNLVAVGQKAYADNSVTGVVYEINTSGDSLFSKEFYNEQGSQNYFRDVIQSPDKGYCFAGFIIPVFANGGTGTQDIWLLKVDSNFCESAIPCNNNVGLSEVEALEATVRVYPNPSNGSFVIEIANEDWLTKPVALTLTDCVGNNVYSATITHPTSTIQTESLADGIYFLTLQTKDKIVTKKIMIEH